MRYDIDKQISDIQKSVTSAIGSNVISNFEKESKRVSEAIAKIDMKPIIDNLHINEQEKQFYFNSQFENLISKINQYLEPLKKLLAKLPDFEKYKNLLEWGNYGWGLVTFLDYEKTYFNKVTSTNEADAIMDSYFTIDLENEIIEKIKNEVELKEIFNEAIDCYWSQKYTACILLLYSIIDSIYIKTQKFPKKRNRPLAGSQSTFLLKNEELEHLGYRYYLKVYVGLHATANLFEYGDDFQLSTDLPNRSFISHGMYNKAVTKLDCLKVLTVLSNVYDIKDFLIEE